MRDERRRDDDEQVIPPWDTDSQSAKANNRSGVQTEEINRQHLLGTPPSEKERVREHTFASTHLYRAKFVTCERM